MNIKSNFIQHLKIKYSSWNNSESDNLLNSLISDQLLSETIVKLPISILSDIQTEINGYYNLRNWGSKNLENQFFSLGLRIPKNEGVCTSFDFHLTENNELKLIEINTNAAFLAMGTELYEFHKIKTDFNTEKILQMFSNESKLTGIENLKNISIIDEEPANQRLYIEFLLFQKIFETAGIKSTILDVPENHLYESADLIYNRYTDFYLSSEKSKILKDLYNSGKINLSPNPYEYFLLADKQRMIDWQNQIEVPVPKSLLKIYDLGFADHEFIWSERKKLFFKPKNSYGSKQAYKGASISRRNFDEFYGPSMLAQEYIQPHEVDVTVTREEIKSVEKMKCDLRCYAYQGKLQIVIARLYQGQTTNLKTTGGGFTVVQFT